MGKPTYCLSLLLVLETHSRQARMEERKGEEEEGGRRGGEERRKGRHGNTRKGKVDVRFRGRLNRKQTADS